MRKKFLEQINCLENRHPLLSRMCNKELTLEDKIFLTGKLGANKFQKIVFKVEDVKYKVLKKICPNYLKYYDRMIDWQKQRKLKKLHSELEKNKVCNEAIYQKKMAHKEFYREMNRNYHINSSRPLEIVNYLEWNKSVHKKGLKNDVVIISCLLGLSLLGVTGALIIIPLELFSAFINFQCINIQNHNIYRFKAKEEQLKKVQLKQLERNSLKYEQANKLIAEKQKELQDVPTIDDIISSVNSKEQLEQLKELIKRQKATNSFIAKQKGKI